MDKNARTVKVAKSGSSFIENVVIPDKLTYRDIEYTVVGIANDAFYKCKELKSVTIPHSVSEIGSWAFYQCPNLICYIPSTVNKIGELAFSECKEIYCESQNQPTDWKNNWCKKSKVVWGANLTDIPGLSNESKTNTNKKKEKTITPSFSQFAKPLVEAEMNAWQKKGEFEKLDNWEKRVTPETRDAKKEELTRKAIYSFVETYYSQDTYFELGKYDAENEVFLISNSKYGNLLVPVPINRAEYFNQQWYNISKDIRYFVENDTIAISEILFTLPNDEQYKYSNQASLNYEMAEIDYNFEPIELEFRTNEQNATRGQQSITKTKKTLGVSDVDVDIPISGKKTENTFAVIIANENYQRVAEVPFAVNDGRLFAEYCRKVLGLSDKNVHFVDNATLNNMKYEINWLKQVIEAYNGDARVIFYYAGHGIPDEAQKTAYLLPVDGYGTDVSTGYKLDDLYAALGNLPSQSVTVFLDACFSGANRNGEMLASARGIAIKAKSSTPVGNMVVFSAAQGDETAYPNNDQQHGMFTYYLLKKLKETKGDVTYKELGDYVSDNVRKQSIVLNGKSQTPTVVPSSSVGEAWQGWKLK